MESEFSILKWLYCLLVYYLPRLWYVILRVITIKLATKRRQQPEMADPGNVGNHVVSCPHGGLELQLKKPLVLIITILNL